MEGGEWNHVRAVWGTKGLAEDGEGDLDRILDFDNNVFTLSTSDSSSEEEDAEPERESSRSREWIFEKLNRLDVLDAAYRQQDLRIPPQ